MESIKSSSYFKNEEIKKLKEEINSKFDYGIVGMMIGN